MNKYNKIIWLIIIALLITTPILGVFVFDDEDIDFIRVFEKKQYTLIKDFFDKDGLNKIAVENYVRQRALFRSEIVVLFKKLNLNLGVSNGPYKTVVVGRDGWYWNSSILDHKTRAAGANEEAIKNNIKIVADFVDYCKQKDVTFVFLTIPESSSVYPEYLPSYYTVSDSKNIAHEVTADIISSSNLKDNYVDMKPIFLKSKEDSDYLLYYKTDGHWTEYAAYLAYKEVMSKLNKFDPNYQALVLEKPVIKNEKHIMNAGSLLGTGLTEDTFEDVQLGDRLPIDNEFLTDDIYWLGLQHYYCENLVNNKNALLIGDSFFGDPGKLFTDIPRQAFAHSFENLYFIHSKKLFNGKEENDYLQKLIEHYDIDVVIHKGIPTNRFKIYENNLDYRRFTHDFALTVNSILKDEKCKSIEFSDGVLNITQSGKKAAILINYIKLKDGVSTITLTLDSDEAFDLNIQFLDIDRMEIANHSFNNISSGTNILTFEKELSESVKNIRLNFEGKSKVYSVSDFYINSVD